MLKKLLNCPYRPETPLYKYLPISTSYPDELQKQVQLLTQSRNQNQNHKMSSDQFISDQYPQNAKNQLILMKLKGFINQKNIRGKSTEIKKLPKKVQFGTVIEGDPIEATKVLNKKKDNSLIDYFLRIDKQTNFSERKFTELQKIKQRHKKIKKKMIKRRKNYKNKNNNLK